MISKNYVRHIATVLSMTSTLAISPLAAQEETSAPAPAEVAASVQEPAYNMDTKNGFLRALDYTKKHFLQVAAPLEKIKELVASPKVITPPLFVKTLLTLAAAFSKEVRADLHTFFDRLKRENKIEGKNADLIPEILELSNAELFKRLPDIVNKLNSLQKS